MPCGSGRRRFKTAVGSDDCACRIENHPFSSPHFLAASQSPHLAAMGPQNTAHAPAPHHPVTAAPQPQFAPIFQAPANAASGQKRLRDRSLGKGSNRGTAHGGVGVV